jgi:uncharacterized membrane protein (UPF0127 family)
MPRTVTIRQLETGQPLLRGVRWGDDFASRLRGFMFRREIARGEALVMVEARDSQIGTSIHMFFVGFSLGVVWVNDGGEVVDKVEALPWRPYYAPRAPARYTLETHPSFLTQVVLGDRWAFDDDGTETR